MYYAITANMYRVEKVEWNVFEINKIQFLWSCGSQLSSSLPGRPDFFFNTTVTGIWRAEARDTDRQPSVQGKAAWQHWLVLSVSKGQDEKPWWDIKSVQLLIWILSWNIIISKVDCWKNSIIWTKLCPWPLGMCGLCIYESIWFMNNFLCRLLKFCLDV